MSFAPIERIRVAAFDIDAPDVMISSTIITLRPLRSISFIREKLALRLLSRLSRDFCSCLALDLKNEMQYAGGILLADGLTEATP